MAPLHRRRGTRPIHREPRASKGPWGTVIDCVALLVHTVAAGVDSRGPRGVNRGARERTDQAQFTGDSV
jgi:hypothetical protein